MLIVAWHNAVPEAAAVLATVASDCASVLVSTGYVGISFRSCQKGAVTEVVQAEGRKHQGWEGQHSVLWNVRVECSSTPLVLTTFATAAFRRSNQSGLVVHLYRGRRKSYSITT